MTRPSTSDTRGVILWLTGLPGSGKSTLAHAINARIGHLRAVEILDGDEVRRLLSKGLGFTKADRDINVYRIAFVARLLARHGVFVMVAAISPYAETRDEVRRLAEADGTRFVEVFLDAPLETLIRRDVKGMYRRALAGEIPHFTGISDPYERPARPDITVNSDSQSIDVSAVQVLEEFVKSALLPPDVLQQAESGS